MKVVRTRDILLRRQRELWYRKYLGVQLIQPQEVERSAGERDGIRTMLS